MIALCDGVLHSTNDSIGILAFWLKKEFEVASPLLFARPPCKMLAIYPKRRKLEGRRTIVGLLDSCSVISQLLDAFGSLGTGARPYSRSWVRRSANKELHKYKREDTPYGTIIESSTITGRQGGLEVDAVNPFALLWHAHSISVFFSEFMKSVVGQRSRLRIGFYLDEMTPGNVHRPDHGRCSQCLYWTIIDWPPWFVKRACGWVPFCYCLVQDMKDNGVTDSMLTRYMVRRFDCNDHLNFSDGVQMEMFEGREVYVLEMDTGPFIADWKQHVATFNLKGYNGSVPCNVCKNCLGRCPEFSDPYFLHVHSPEHSRFDLHTDASFRLAADEVKHAVENGIDADAKQQYSGIKYDPDGLLWDEEVSKRMPFPSSQYIDWLHTFASSGGIAQYNLNQLVLQLVAAGIEIEDIDTWIESVRLPRGHTKLKKKFFASRIVHNEKAHIKAFANEVLTAVMCLGFFIDAVLKLGLGELGPQHLQDHLDCFDLLRTILRLLSKGEEASIPRYMHTYQLYHAMYARLYPTCKKPKLHAGMHVGMYWYIWKVLLSCWGPERHHKLAKSIMGFSYNKAATTVLAYDVRHLLERICRRNSFKPIHMANGKPMNKHVLLTGIGEGTITEWGTQMTTEHGTLCRDDLLHWGAGVSSYGLALGFVLMVVNGQERYGSVVRDCLYDAAAGSIRLTNRRSMVFAECVPEAVPYLFVDADKVVPFIHVL